MDSTSALDDGDIEPIVDQDASGERTLRGRACCNAHRFLGERCQILLPNLYPVDASGRDLGDLPGQPFDRIYRVRDGQAVSVRHIAQQWLARSTRITEEGHGKDLYLFRCQAW